MEEKKITMMAIKVDLHCEKCRRKIKKVLCSIPQVQNQEYNEKTNTVRITVLCCCPEKVMKKICCKGGNTVKSIEIIVPEKRKPADSDKPKPTEKPPDSDKPKPTEKPPKEPEKKPTLVPVPCVPVYPPPVVRPTCCTECYEGRPYGPCYYGMPVYESWGGGYGIGCYVTKCDYYLCEENPQACIIM